MYLSDINIYCATVLDRMHHLDLGLFHYQIDYTNKLLKTKDKSLVDKMNRRIASIPRHPDLIIFKKGLQFARLTAKEYKNLIKIMVFVVDELDNKNLTEVYINEIIYI